MTGEIPGEDERRIRDAGGDSHHPQNQTSEKIGQKIAQMDPPGSYGHLPASSAKRQFIPKPKGALPRTQGKIWLLLCSQIGILDISFFPP